MKCDKIQIHLPSYAAGHLGSGEVPAIRAHLDGCPDCRTSLEKTTRLRSLLAFKRHEQPDEFFFRTYLSNFHRRLISDMARQPASIWTQVREAFTRWETGSLLPRLAYGAAFAVFVLSLYIARGSMDSSTAPAVALRDDSGKTAVVAASGPSVVEIDSHFNHLVLAENHAAKNPVYVLDRVAYKPSNHGADVIEF